MKCMYCGSTQDRLALGVVCSKKCMDMAVEDAVDSATLRGVHRSAIVTGGRDYTGTHHDRAWFMSMLILLEVSQVVHGGAYGADTWCASIAKEMGLDVKEHPADWDTHGKAAGHMRNSDMLRETKDIQAVIGFPGGKGTANMLKQAVMRPFTSKQYPIILSNGVSL